jgi:predicted aldo/keto reductase-like oxidoreductase
MVAYTATRWGQLPDPKKTPPGETTPRGSDCYRFALSHPAVDVVLCGPKNAEELEEGMAALDRGPMNDDELAWMKRVGAHVSGKSAGKAVANAVNLADRIGGTRV